MPVQSRLLAILAASLIGGCASAPEGAYPSLAVRDVERVAGTLAPPAPASPPPAAPAPATLDLLAELKAQAGAAHALFLAAAPAARGAVAAAAGAAEGSDGWARAQVSLAGLEAIRSQAMIALADLERIYVDAAVASEPLERIEADRAEVLAMVEEEDALIAALVASLR